MDRIKLDTDNIVHINLEGDTDGPMARDIVEKMNAYTQTLHEQQLPVYLCVFLDTKGDSDKDARQIWVEFLRKKTYDKVVFWGGNIFTENIARFIMMVSGNMSNFAFFKSEKEAHDWLIS